MLFWTENGILCYHERMIKDLFSVLIASCLALPAIAGNVTIPTLTIGNDTYKNATVSYKAA